MHYVYIIYSAQLNRYYVGETPDVEDRLRRHRSGYYRGSYTSKAQDWELRLTITCRNRSQALSIERAIKRRKSRKYIEDLLQHENLVTRLLERYE